MRSKFILMATTAALALAFSDLTHAQQGASGSGAPVPSAQSPSAVPSSTATSGTLTKSMLREVDDDKAMVQGLNVSAEDLGDMSIHGSDGKKIGEVNKILADSSNSVKAVTVDVGGFLGIGAREVIIPIDKLTKGKENDQLQTSMTKAEIEKLDEWTDNRDRTRDANPRSTSTPSSTSPSRPDAAPSGQ